MLKRVPVISFLLCSSDPLLEKRFSFSSKSYVISITLFGWTMSFSGLGILGNLIFEKIRAQERKRENGWYIYLKNLLIDFLAVVFEIFHICGYGSLPPPSSQPLPPSSPPSWHSQRSLEKFLPSSILSLTSPLSSFLIILGNVVTLIAFSH